MKRSHASIRPTARIPVVADGYVPDVCAEFHLVFVCFHVRKIPNPLRLSTDFRNFYFVNRSRFGTIIVWMVGTIIVWMVGTIIVWMVGTIPGPSTALSVCACGCGFALGANTATARSDHSQIVFDLAHALHIS